MGGRGRRSRTQRKHFKDGRENVWKRPRSDAQQQDEFNAKKHWEPFATQNASFDAYYKVYSTPPYVYRARPHVYDFCQFLQYIS